MSSFHLDIWIERDGSEDDKIVIENVADQLAEFLFGAANDLDFTVTIDGEFKTRLTACP